MLRKEENTGLMPTIRKDKNTGLMPTIVVSEILNQVGRCSWKGKLFHLLIYWFKLIIDVY